MTEILTFKMFENITLAKLSDSYGRYICICSKEKGFGITKRAVEQGFITSECRATIDLAIEESALPATPDLVDPETKENTEALNFFNMLSGFYPPAIEAISMLIHRQ